MRRAFLLVPIVFANLGLIPCGMIIQYADWRMSMGTSAAGMVVAIVFTALGVSNVVTLLLGRRAWKALRSVMVGVNVLLVVAIAAFGVLVFSHRPRDAEVTPPYLPLATLLLIPVGTIHLLRTVPKAAASARDEVEPSGVIDP